MSHFNSQLKTLVAILAALQLSACSKTVTWEEEVPLNTGETIWVTRTVVYRLKGAGGNPFDIGYGQDRTEKIEFKWNEKSYAYEGDADLILLAISPQKQPVFAARASDKGWDWIHNYYCATPHYVQLIPDASGREWTWPPQIEHWLYGLPANLMGHRNAPEKMKHRYTAIQREKEDAIGHLQIPSRGKIDSSFTINNNECKRNN